MCDLEKVPKVEKQSPISVINRDTDLDIGAGIYDRIDENNLGASPISTGEDLYDDALMGKMELLDYSQNSKSSSQEMTEKEVTEKMDGSKMGVDEVIENLTPPKDHNAAGQRRFAVYVGNLTWWTTHEQIVEAVKLIGVNDILDVKILDCRANGQSKGYCLLTLGSDASVKSVMEQLGKLEIHGRALVVKPDSKLTVAYFESQTKCRPPSSSLMQQGEIQVTVGTRGQIPTIGNNGGISRFGLRNPQQQFRGRGSSAIGALRPWGPSSCTIPISGGQRYVPRNGVFSMPPRGPPPMNYGHSASFDEWRYASTFPGRVHYNPAFLNRPVYPSTPEIPDYCPSSLMTLDEFGGSQNYFINNKPMSDYLNNQLVAEDELSPSSTPNQPENNVIFPSTLAHVISSTNSSEENLPSGSKLDLDELLDRHNSICSQAIERAVNDATQGDYAGAIETLVTAISLIKGSKISGEKRCQVMIYSLKDTLEGIEHRSYGVKKSFKEKSRVMNSSHRRSRSPVPRNRCDSSSQRNYDRESESSSRGDRSRRRTLEERNRRHSSSELVERDPQRSKVSRLELGKDYFRR